MTPAFREVTAPHSRILRVTLEVDNAREYWRRPEARPEHGDWSTNAELVCSKLLGKNPREIGQALADELSANPPKHVEAVTPGEDGLGRIVIANFDGHRRTRGNVGRIAHDEVHGSVELPQQRRVGDVPEPELDGGLAGTALPVGVVARPGEGFRILFHGIHRSVGARVGHGQRQRPGARAQVHHHGGVHALQRGQAPCQQQLGLRTGNEHTRSDGHRDAAERGLTGQVLERHVRRAPAHQVVQRLHGGGVHQGHHHQLGALHTEQVGGQQFDVGTWARHSGRGQNTLGLQDGQA